MPSVQAGASSQHLSELRRARLGYCTEAAVFLLLGFAPLAIGTVELWSWAIVSALTLVGFFLIALREHPRVALTPLGVLLAAVVLLTALQALPLPAPLVRWLSPATYELYAASGLSQAQAPPGLMSVSLSSAATLAECAKLLTLFLLFLIGANYFVAASERQRRLLVAIVVTATLVTVVGFAQKFFFDNKIFGLYALDGPRFFVSTFVNPNHFGGFLGLAIPLALALALDPHRPERRLLFGGLALFLSVTLFLNLSRGAIGAFLVGMFAYGVLLWRRQKGKAKRKVLVLPVFVIIVLGAAGALAYTPLASKLGNLRSLTLIMQDPKVRGWADHVRILRDFPLTGVGRGAFVEANAHYSTFQPSGRYFYTENEYLQSLVDWGIPLGGLLLLGVGWTFAAAVRSERSSSGSFLTGSIVALGVVALHNLFDFNLETGAVAAPAALLLGMLAGKRRYRRFHFLLSVPSSLVIWGIGALVTPIAYAASAHWSLDQDTSRLRQASGTSAWPEVAQAVLYRHPADDFLRVQVANEFLTAKPHDPAKAFFLLERALSQNPYNDTAHMLSARLALSQGAVYIGLSEYQQASRLGRREEVLNEVLSHLSDPELLRLAVAPELSAQLELVTFLRTHGHVPHALAIAKALASEDDKIELLRLVVGLAENSGDRALVKEYARAALRRDASQAWAYAALARQLPPGPDRQTVYLTGLEETGNQTTLLDEAVSYAVSAKDFEFATALARRTSGAPALYILGQIEEARARYPMALESYRAAAVLAPENIAYLLAGARMFELMGIRSQAIAEYEAIWRQGHQPEWLKNRLEQLKRPPH